MPTAPPRHYYVRINGKVRGPFDVGRLVSMCGRGRLNPRDEVSLDRRQWVAAGTIPEVFPEGFAGTDRNPEALDWHYNCRGQQMGPVSLATLQTLAQGGQLASTDSVWKLGTSGWILANQVPELTFPQPPESWWAKSSGATKAGILVAASIMFMAPIGLVLANYWHTIDIAKQQIAQQIEHQKLKLDQEERIAEQQQKERQHKETLDAAARADAKRDEMLVSMHKQHQENLKAISSSNTASNTASTTSASGKFNVGDKVKNTGFLVGWTGTIVAVSGQTHRVRIDYADSDFGRGKYRGQEVSLLENEFQ
ncbi:MAG: DUF4339 domain-containing protein, partial [Planctomycetota bacterium]